MMGRKAMKWLCLSLVLLLLDGSEAHNVVGEPSFESAKHWEVRERPSMWDVVPATAEYLAIEEGAAHNGSKALRLGPISGKKPWAVFVTQYIPNSNIPKLDGRPLLKVQYWVKKGDRKEGTKEEVGQEGKDSDLSVHLDVMYADSSHLMALIPPVKPAVTDAAKDHNGFVRTCTVIPAYGGIRAMGIHISLQGESKQAYYVDDVRIDVVEHVDDKDCPVYVDSFPKRRQVMANFLAPTVPFTNRSISLCTQMTFDRLDNLISTAQVWNGPISVALLLFRDGKISVQEQMQQLTQKYYASAFLSNHVAIHVILQDELNEQDAVMYPVNFLRNVALKFASTSHVFFVDADISPGFSERQAWEWMTQAQSQFQSDANEKCLRCAFISPLMNVKGTAANLPGSKHEMLTALATDKDTFETFNAVSHTMVNYQRWRTENKSYEVNHRKDQEPYFIVSREAPLLNDLFAGYGRDKCVYIKELNNLKYTFVVLAESFLLNRLDPRGTKTIMGRSRGLHLRVFLSLELHLLDMLGGFSTTRDNFLPQQKEVNVVTNRTKCMSSDKLGTEKTPPASAEQEEDGGISCHINMFIEDLIGKSDLPIKLYWQPDGLRKDVLVEKMMQQYRVGLFIEYPKTLTGTIRLMFPIMHPDAAITLIPGSEEEKYIVDGLFQVYRSPNNVSEMLSKVRKHHKGPAIISVNTADVENLSSRKLQEYIFAALTSASDRDIVLFQGHHPSLTGMHRDMCNVHPNWKIYHQSGSNVYVLKSASLVKNLPVEPMTPPQLVLSTERPQCDPQHTKVDVILMTRNRPLQTYSFLDSLRIYVSNVNKIWVLYRADSDLFKDGYDLALSCAGRSLPVEGVQDLPGEFGSKVLEIVQKSEAQYIVLAVDEMIWLRHVDLQYSACLLKKGEGAFHSVQLRLGKSLGCFPKDQDIINKRFFPMAHNSSVLAYFPLRLDYDFGYVLNVDGTMVSRSDFLEDLGDSLPRHRHPGDLENGWVYKKTHVRNRQWHITYTHSNVVNNMELYDGRMADHKANISQDAHNYANKFVKDKQKIDVVHFVSTHGQPSATHIKKKVTYTDLEC